MIYKFVDHEIDAVDTLKDTRVYQLHDKLVTNRQKPTREDKNDLFDLLDRSSYKTRIALMGWMFSFREILKEYWVQYTYGQIDVIYALDKTSIRQNDYITCIQKIVEIK